MTATQAGALAAWRRRVAHAVTGLDSPATRRRVCLAVPVLFGLWSLLLGMDANWDLLNYHLYDPFALLHGKLSIDLAPAGLQTYFNPLLDVPYYVANRWLPAPLVGFALGALHGLAFPLLVAITRELLHDLETPERERMAMLLALAGVLAPDFLSGLGNSMGDDTTALLTLCAVLLVVRGSQPAQPLHPARATWIAVGGFVMGLGAGLKLTNAPYAVALALALLVRRSLPLRSRWRDAGLYCVAAALGLAITGGWWWLEMWTRFRNPLFPQFGSLFPNDLARAGALADTQFRPRTLVEALAWPFVFAFDPLRVGQVPLRHVLWPFVYALGWVHVATRIARRGTPSPSAAATRFLLLFVGVGYVVWMALFSVSRYLVAIEVLLPLLAFLLLRELLPYFHARRVAAWTLSIATAVVLAGGFTTWGHRDWALHAFAAELPPLAEPRRTTVLLVGEDPPWGWLATLFPADVAFAQVGGNFPEGVAYAPRVHAIVSARGGAAFAIVRAHRDVRAESVARIDRLLAQWGVTSSERGCAALRWAAASLGMRYTVHAGTSSQNGRACELRVRASDARDIATDNRREQQAVAGVLGRYGFEMAGERCIALRAYIGGGVEPYQWCPIAAPATPPSRIMPP